MPAYDPVPKSDRDIHSRGRRCRNCGEPGFEHSLRRTGQGQESHLVGYTMQCPDADPGVIPDIGEGT